jgi:hypothetical protein
MDEERMVEEYVRLKSQLEALEKHLGAYKKQLSDIVDSRGDTDDRGHRWLSIGRFTLQRQRRQGKKQLDMQAAEQWAKDSGFWDEVKVVREFLDEDALLGYVFTHRKDDPSMEDRLQTMYTESPPVWSFQPPIEQKQYDY